MSESALPGASPSGSQPLTLLLVNEQAEEVKQTTIRMRQAYPGCRVEAVYSAEEALEWAPRQDWHVILLDEQLAHRHAVELLPELRRQAPASAIIVQAEHHDAQTVAKIVEAGADLFLYKKSPAFLTELPLVTRSILAQQALRKELAAERERHSCVIEQFPGLLYELDADGRFVAIGTGISSVLGYRPQELIGKHYTLLLHPDEGQPARYHVHERRTGLRAQHDKSVRLVGKHGGTVRVTCRTAGLYGQHRRFLGTIGTLTPLAEDFSSSSPATAGETSAVSPAGTALGPTLTEKERLSPSRHERRQAARVRVHMEASLHLRDAAYPGVVRDISLTDAYVVVQGIPPVTRDHPVRLDFSLDGAILQVRGTITEVRQALTPRVQAGLGLVIRYSELGPIERPILSSLVEELRLNPSCAKVTIVPSLTRSVQAN